MFDTGDTIFSIHDLEPYEVIKTWQTSSNKRQRVSVRDGDGFVFSSSPENFRKSKEEALEAQSIQRNKVHKPRSEWNFRP